MQAGSTATPAHNCAIDLAGTKRILYDKLEQRLPRPTVRVHEVGPTSRNPQVNSTIPLHADAEQQRTTTGADTNVVLTDTLPSGYAVTGLSAPSSTSSSSTSTSVTVNYDTPGRTPVQNGDGHRQGFRFRREPRRSTVGRLNGQKPARGRPLPGQTSSPWRDDDSGEDPDRRPR